MLRKISAVLLGLLVSAATVVLIEWISHQVYPVPPGMDFNDAEQLRLYISNLPLGAFLFVLLSWLLGTLAGAVVACQLAQEKPAVFGSIIGAVMLAAGIANLVAIPHHPTWFSIAGIVVIAAGALLAIRWSSSSGSRMQAF